ncbi:MAG: chromate resistance protein ChrB domain-containing protein [Desulfococcaceae bacterium]|nr:chromate resistance protein ChrB domain-containing protein [Desulfococcaceae bacterium]
MTVLSAHAQLLLYKTWAPWEPDSFLAAWALKRYVYPEAEFMSFPKGTPLLPGTAPEMMIDTPNAKYRRNATKTAFEEVVRIHNLKIPCYARIRAIVRLLEMSRWRKSENREAEDFERNLRSLLPQGPATGGLDAAFAYADEFCRLHKEKDDADGRE